MIIANALRKKKLDNLPLGLALETITNDYTDDSPYKYA